MRVVIIGQQAFGKSVLEAFVARDDEVVGVFCAPEKEGARPDPLRQAAQQLGVTVVTLPALRGAAAEEALAALGADLAVMAFVLQFAPQNLVTVPRHGTIQYHPSLLPRYRGPSSINWPLIKGDRQTGLTIFRPTDGLDEGPIILQKTVEIGPDDTVGTVYFDRLFPMGVAALLEAADLVVSGHAHERPQDETLATYEGWCRDPQAQINWYAHLDAIHNLIRGCDPSPGAWTTIGGSRVRLFDARKHVARRFSDVAGKIGDICAIGDQSLQIAVQGGRLEVFKMRADGGGKMPAAAFAAAARLKVGSNLSVAVDPLCLSSSCP
jgi:methionyl-tRNA formyltransferase